MNTIHHDLVINASTEDLFDALTNPEGLNAWWTNQSKGRPYLGENYQFYFSKEYEWEAEVIAVERCQSIAYKMTKADKDWIETTLDFNIKQETKGQQLLRFEHQAWKRVNDHFRRTNYCWALYLNGLKQYLETGLIKPYGQRT